MYCVLQDGARKLFTYLHRDHAIWVSVVAHQGSLLMRLSASIYSTANDFEKLKVAVLVAKQQQVEVDIDDTLSFDDWQL